jgi:RNA polymerase sigma-70 factor (ECF subfamily)
MEAHMIPDEAAMNFDVECRQSDSDWAGEWPQTVQEFESIVDSFLDRLVRSAFRRLGNIQEAEDVVQDVFVKAYADRSKLRHVQRVGPYLYRMVDHACANQRRKHGWNSVSLDEIGPDAVPDRGREEIAAAEELQRIEQFLRRIPRDQAAVIRLRVLDELSLSEIAEVVGCSVPTAKSRLHYGLQKLRRIVPQSKEESR